MKIIITEEQYERVAKSPSRLWILRNYQLVEEGLIETINDVNPCRFDSYEKYESFFFAVFMDVLHPHFYLNDNFDYDGVETELKDLFYVDATEAFSEGKKKCL
jgi:hypothetical protein